MGVKACLRKPVAGFMGVCMCVGVCEYMCVWVYVCEYVCHRKPAAGEWRQPKKKSPPTVKNSTHCSF